MDDIIPFLIVIAISIVSAVARKKKKRFSEQNITSAPISKSNDDFLSWMEKLAGVEDESPIPYQRPLVDQSVVTEVKKPEVKTQPMQSETKNQHAGYITMEEKQRLMAKEAPHAFEFKKEQSVNDPIKNAEIGTKRPKVDFELRKAVIYSEILNRKYS